MLNALIIISIVTLVAVCILLIIIVLMQRPKQEGLGAAFGGGMTDQVFGAQTTNVLQKFTVYLAGIFFLTVLIISILTLQKNKKADTGLSELTASQTTETNKTDTANQNGKDSQTNTDDKVHSRSKEEWQELQQETEAINQIDSGELEKKASQSDAEVTAEDLRKSLIDTVEQEKEIKLGETKPIKKEIKKIKKLKKDATQKVEKAKQGTKEIKQKIKPKVEKAKEIKKQVEQKNTESKE